MSAVCDVHQFLFYSELPCIFAKNHIFRIFRHKAFPDLGEIDSVCRASNSKAFFFFSILNLNYIVVFQKGNFFRILCFYYRT